MKKFIALVALVMMSAATTAMYAQESRAERRADRKAQRDAERARLKAEEQVADLMGSGLTLPCGILRVFNLRLFSDSPEGWHILKRTATKN